MNKRQTIPKSTRFAVLKRDRFRCKYCGISAEEADEPLQIDHVKPVSKGGTNDITNLVTSCFPCNNGKRDELLTQNVELELQRAQIEEMQAKREQLEMMVEWREESQNLQNSEVEFAAQYWEQATFGDPHKCCDIMQLKHLIKRFGSKAVCDGMDETIATYLRDNTKQRHEYAWQKLKRVIEVNQRDQIEPGYKAKTMAIGYMLHARMLPKWAITMHNKFVDYAQKCMDYNLEDLIKHVKASKNYPQLVDRVLGLPIGSVQSTIEYDVTNDPDLIFQAMTDSESGLSRLTRQHYNPKQKGEVKEIA